MREHGYVEGTTGITYVHKKDDRRHRKRCTHYRKDGSCAYMSKCGGAAHCQFYAEDSAELRESYVDISVVKKDTAKNGVIVEKKQYESAEAFIGVETIRMDDIIVPDKFLRRKPDSQKVAELYEYYRQHKRLDKPIYVSVKNGKYYLEDKYLRYYVAKELGKTWISARIGTRSESMIVDKLNRIGGRVKHKKYGVGTIISNNGKYVEVAFDVGKDVKFDLEICINNKIFED